MINVLLLCSDHLPCKHGDACAWVDAVYRTQALCHYFDSEMDGMVVFYPPLDIFGILLQGRLLWVG